MRPNRQLWKAGALALGVVAGLPAFMAAASEVTYQDLRRADANTADWLMYSRTYDGQPYVRLSQVTPGNVDLRRPVWVFPTGGENRGLEATPLIHDGVIYLAADQSRVFAIDARSGQTRWHYDPKLSKDIERIYCCGSNNRGVALLGALVYVGTMDARLVLSARTPARSRGK